MSLVIVSVHCTRALAVLLLMVSITVRASENANRIVKLADEGRGPQTDYSATIHVLDVQDGDKKDSTFRLSAKGNQFALVEQTAPARQAGRKLLMRDTDLWLYNPNISRPVRISFEQRLTGEVANGDIMRTNFAMDYSATVAGEEIISKKAAYKLHLVAKNSSVTYRAVDYWVDKKSYRPIKAVFYALSGKALKTAVYQDFKMILGKSRMTTAIITDQLQKGHYSQVVFSKHKKESFDDAFFSKEAMGQ